MAHKIEGGREVPWWKGVKERCSKKGRKIYNHKGEELLSANPC
jgi:hypothetical protein